MYLRVRTYKNFDLFVYIASHFTSAHLVDCIPSSCTLKHDME